MLKTIVLGAAALFVATGAVLADKRDLNNDGQVATWEIHEYYTQENGEYRR